MYINPELNIFLSLDINVSFYNKYKQEIMRIISMHIFKWEEEKSLFISSAYDLSFVKFITHKLVGFRDHF